MIYKAKRKRIEGAMEGRHNAADKSTVRKYVVEMRMVAKY